MPIFCFMKKGKEEGRTIDQAGCFRNEREKERGGSTANHVNRKERGSAGHLDYALEKGNKRGGMPSPTGGKSRPARKKVQTKWGKKAPFS